jgi:acylphosphatase
LYNRVMSTVHCVISGRVQGVGFRFFVENEARSLGLCGWVRNLRAGQVEVKASGPEESLRLLLRRLDEGPVLSRVTGLEIDWGGEETNAPFHIR